MGSNSSREQISLLVPDMPIAEQVLPFLQKIDEARVYSNGGPLVQELEAMFANYFKVERNQVCAVTNATLGLMAAIKVHSESSLEVVELPSFTFTASASACLMSGVSSRFVDIDDEFRMTPSGQSRFIMDVLPFGAGLRNSSWYNQYAYTVIDAAASVDALNEFGTYFKPVSPVVIVVSLHATKMLGAGEGGIVYSNNLEILSRIRRYCNFGFDQLKGARSSNSPGSNFKMSEYSAAVALASFSRWQDIRQDAIQRNQLAQEICRRTGFLVHSAMEEGLATPYWIIRSHTPDAITSLSAASKHYKIGTRKWWENGCHKMPAYSSISRSTLPMTEKVSKRYLGLPFHRHLTDGDWNRIESFLGSI